MLDDIVYIYQADIYCEDCGLAIIRDLEREGVEPSEESDEWPQAYPNAGGESDVPHHCGSGEECVNAEYIKEWGRSVGCLLGNPLTEEGYEYVAEKVQEEPDNPVYRMRLDEYPEAYDLLPETLREKLLEE